MIEATGAVSLEEAVRSAVEQGHAELASLGDITDELVGVFAREQGDTSSSAGSVGRLDDFTCSFPVELRSHLHREHEALGTFNVAFFGRTGVGKSTLLSVFGRLDGEYVSPGDSDWTTEVQPIEWRDCRLYDTPGINGWGRTESRAHLEAKARKAVEIADIVLLCFDSQAQQVTEFEKIAGWVRDHGKPVVAVLNVRNLHWRHPLVAPEAGRRNSTAAVRQHHDNIRTHLVEIGLPGTPIVAIHSLRALFARAATPFRGPDQIQRSFHVAREQFGTAYLDRWSNFGTLERLIVAAIAEGGADLRLSALREDIRSRCRRGIGELDKLNTEIELEAASREREAESLFALLGYPEKAERAGWLHDEALGADLVELSEQTRGRPYTSPGNGTLDRSVRHLAASHLAGARRQAKAAADDLIRESFEKNTKIDEAGFAGTVYDQNAFSVAADAVWAARQALLEHELQAAVEHTSAGHGPATSHAAKFFGGEGKSRTGDVVRGTGIVASLAVPAAALFWNPVGWGFAAAAATVGIALQVQQHFGKKMSNESSERARKAKAQAITECHDAVDKTFNDYEDALVRESRKAAWTLSGPAVAESLRAAIELRKALGRIALLTDGLGTYAAAIRPAPATDVLSAAQRRMGETPAEVTRVLLGEDWLESGVLRRSAQNDQAAQEAYAIRREQDGKRLTRVLAAAWSAPSPVAVQLWRNDLEDAARADPGLFEMARTFRRVAGAKPALAVLGDYNSGKSSLIRRIVVDDGQRLPATFDIRAAPATTAAARYEFPRFDLVDTPGLQSGHDEHDTAAFEAIAEAALVFVVVHINLLVGNTSILEELARGSERIAAKGARMVFLINRCDELGVDPLIEPEAFLNMQDRKREELRAALATRSIAVGAERIHCLSGDPFGLVGDDAAAESGHFDENRRWDGVAALTSAMSDADLSAAASSAAFDAAVTELRCHRHALHQESAVGAKELDRSEPVITALGAALSGAAVLESSLREDARRMVGRHAVTAKAAVAELDRKDGQKLQDLVDSWWKGPQFEDDLKRHLADAARKLDEWRGDHISAIGREMRAADFQVAPEFAAEFEARGPAWHEGVAGGVGKVAGSVASLAKAIGSRDAVYSIGKFFDFKFQPWGAVKGGARVAKVGAVLGIVAAAVDGATMANDLRKAGEHREQQELAQRAIDESAARILDQIVDGEQGEGPVGHLGQWTRELETLLEEHRHRASAIRERMNSANARAEVAATLITAAEELIGTAGENE